LSIRPFLEIARLNQCLFHRFASLPPEERRQIMSLIDAFIERGQLKRSAGTNAGY
jgi:hypothetical protein